MKPNLKIASLIMIAVASACSQPKEDSDSDRRILVEVGDSVLYEDEVERLIPAGLLPEDSVAMFNEITDRWVETLVMEDLARENVVDLERIDRLTQTYRNRLIVDEYLRKMGSSAPIDVDKKEVEEFYRQYGDSMILTQPLVKGLYLRTSGKDPQLENIRKWMQSASPEDIDLLEKKGLREATGYEYFLDKWVEWSDIAEQIPQRIEDADLFVKENQDFEVSRGGSIYLLHISDYVGSGNPMPKEYALIRISDILADRRAGEYRKKLRYSIYRQAMREHKLKKGLYDPLERFR